MDPEVLPGSVPGTRGPQESPAAREGEGWPGCPFCPGNEAGLGEIVQETRTAGGWATRAVLNRYPFLEAGEGVQEVLIETRRHDTDLVDLEPEEVVGALRLFRERVRAQHRAHPGWEVHLFRNRGRDAGTSRRHPHAQLVALPGPTPDRQALELAQAEFHAAQGRCLVCGEVEALDSPSREGGDPGGGRRVYEGEHFVAGTLRAPLDPFHLRIFPRRHASSFAGATEAELGSLAGALKAILGAVDEATGRASYNLLVHGHGPSPSPALHWHIELRPRLGRAAGFEQMTGLWVCPSDPVEDAAVLSALIASHPNP